MANLSVNNQVIAAKLPGTIPEASSTALKMHKLYTLQPPHDSSLYNALRVSPNATLAEITKSYRKRTRELHPDKQRHHNNTNSAQDELEKVRHAYEVLKNDKTRLVYHRYGLFDTSVAALLLTGNHKSTIHNKQQRQLLHLMGFGPKLLNPHSSPHKQRVLFLAANLVERIRPLVEGAVSEATLAESIARECDSLKHLPLGAQILRCVGRAYRHVGQGALKRHEALSLKKKNRHFRHYTGNLKANVHDQYRNAKHLLTAAVASGRFVLTEQIVQKSESKRNKRKNNGQAQIGYHNDKVFHGLLGEDEVDNLDFHLQTTQEIRQDSHAKAQKAVLEALQVEALWKIYKVDLDRTIQEACNLIVTGQYFFFPSHQSPRRLFRRHRHDGWVGSTGQTIDTQEGQLRAAAALVLVGDVMVKCSKQGTAWME